MLCMITMAWSMVAGGAAVTICSSFWSAGLSGMGFTVHFHFHLSFATDSESITEPPGKANQKQTFVFLRGSVFSVVKPLLLFFLAQYLLFLFTLRAQCQDDVVIFQRRGIPGHGFGGHDFPQQRAHDLAAAGLGQGGHEDDFL